MPFRLLLHQGPFTPTAALQNHFAKYRLEHAAIDGGRRQWREQVPVWMITNDAGDECGYAWWTERLEEQNARDISIAVFDQFAHSGAGTAALQNLEEEALRRGIPVLCAQVNSNLPDTGLRVRHWLIRRGFQLFDRPYSSYSWMLSDAEYIDRYPNPVYFRKWYFPEIPAMRRNINPHDLCEDFHGNNAAIKCPMCMKVYVVSRFIDPNGRACPKCGGSKGFVIRLTGGQLEAYVEWPIRPAAA